MNPDLFLSIVIPCYHEPNVIQTLISLSECELPKHHVEISVIINHSENDSEEIKTFNNACYEKVKSWIQDFKSNCLQFHLMLVEFEDKHAGVGLARKTGMDEAYRRFMQIQKENGVIVCLDADCVVAKNYLVEIETIFLSDKKYKGCSIYFEHFLSGNENKTIYDAIALYEFFLRYYINALRWCGHPFAFQTIGSSMAVRADIYMQQGGMNKRKAGEDFYFLNKIIELGDFIEINGTTVYPSSRISNRVPFGTGKAVADYVNESAIWFYDFKTFDDLKIFFETVLNDPDKKYELLTSVPNTMKQFFLKENLQVEFDQIAQNSSDAISYKKRFFRWFNLFKVLKFVHFVAENYYERKKNHEEARELFLHLQLPFSRDLVNDLKTIRVYDHQKK